jgi:putative addiction module component (TIGR02574 family)
MSNAAADVDRLMDLALALPPALRELVAFRIWESLHQGESWPLAQEQLDEVQRRAAEIEDGEVELVDGDDMIRKARARIAAHRRS